MTKKEATEEKEQHESRCLQVPCIECDAAIGQRCMSKGAVIVNGFHSRRMQLANKMIPMVPSVGLTPTQKALITYYAYIMLCDSTAVQSTKLIGREVTSQEIQRFFAEKAIAELRKDGLIK